MGTFELINAIGSLVGGGLLTIWAQGMKDRADRERLALEAALARHEATENAQARAREFRSDRGFHFTRRLIAIIVVLSVVLLPVILPAIYPDMTIVIGYYDTARGFWPWSSTYETINWVAVGSGVRPIVISPVTNNILITIIGMFFGNQITKR
ncbi:MAG: hypothetical protein V2I43_19720 [Parvularcula sp.]|jgi:hypothetical protein|nr:hypothetical protein [Parvularcula sp.]